MSNELMKQEQSTALALSDMMESTGITASDLVIPKLLLMQNTSEYVGDGKAVLGDIVNSQTMEVVGSLKTPCEIIPLKMYKTWRIYDVSSKSPRFIRQEAVTRSNEKLPWDDVENGTPIRRDQCINFFALIKTELDTGNDFPCAISFRRSSFSTGKQLATQLFRMTMQGKLPYSESVMLGVKKEKNDTNYYSVYTMSKGAELTKEQQASAAKWLSMLSSVSYKVDDESEEKTQSQKKPTVVVSQDDVGF